MDFQPAHEAFIAAHLERRSGERKGRLERGHGHGEKLLLIEIKGFAPPVRDMDRHKFCRELNRETFLHAMGFSVISFVYDDIEQRPELCIRLLRMVISRYQTAKVPVERAVLAE